MFFLRDIFMKYLGFFFQLVLIICLEFIIVLKVYDLSNF